MNQGKGYHSIVAMRGAEFYSLFGGGYDMLFPNDGQKGQGFHDHARAGRRRAYDDLLPDGEHDRVFPPASGPVAGGTERKLRFFCASAEKNQPLTHGSTADFVLQGFCYQSLIGSDILILSRNQRLAVPTSHCVCVMVIFVSLLTVMPFRLTSARTHSSL